MTTPCSCPCGTTTLTTHAPPRFRMLCHCTICQRFNKASFADVLVYRSRDVALPKPGTVAFSTWKPPPNCQRGKCVTCGAPAVETFHAPLLPKLTMVPRAMFPTEHELPSPVAHFFYERRVADSDDALPKHEGFLPSQVAFLKCYLDAKRRS